MIYRRPTLQTLVLTATIAVAASALLTFSHPAQLMVDGEAIQSDVPPITTSADKVYVPLRSLTEALGAQTIAEGDRIYVVRGNQSLRLRVGDTHATINGMPITFKHPPFRVRGRVMIGLKAIARAFNVTAAYDARTARIDVMTPGIGQAQTQPTPATQ